MTRTGRPALELWKVSKAMELRAAGSSWSKIAAELGIGRTTAREAVLGKRRPREPVRKLSGPDGTSPSTPGQPNAPGSGGP